MRRNWGEGLIDERTRETMDAVLDTGFELHRAIGPGHLESVYRKFLSHGLMRSGHVVDQEMWLAVEYDGLRLEKAYRADIVVNKCVVVETKAVETLHPVRQAQVIAYLKASGIKAGMLLNFNVAYFRNGYDRLLHPDLLKQAKRIGRSIE